MASGKIAFTELKGWIDDYKKTINIHKETRSCLLSLAELRSLITYIDTQNIYRKDKIDGVRVYFTRPGVPNNQMSIAIVPTHKYSDTFEFTDENGKVVPCAGAHDYKDQDGEIYVVMPGGLNSEHTGLCPPNCGGGQ